MSLREALRAAPLVEDVPGVHLLAIGHGWDTVRVSADAGFLALARLRTAEERLGPVLYDRPGERLYFAVPTGSRGAWDGLSVRLLSKGSWLVAPNPYRCDEWFGGWCELPDDERLTAPETLRRALEQPQIDSAEPVIVCKGAESEWKPSNVLVLTPTSGASPRASLPRSAWHRS
ncbi:hypothetical protein [Streptomyces malaysiensis]|uniref:Uncharacterized protein n=1 Tax=Streptomyces malaysiensis TaxID=92644 RepID=A0A7X5X7C5_STRMQ|nr:hypothetical protein [Streptomyces malaysiensis]NIY67902.1 hypothetical protein [Streptomyces malaysiensis]